MAATVGFISGGTITALKTPTTGNTSTGSGSAGNVPTLQSINPLDFTGGSKQGMENIPDEIRQFVNICSTGDNNTSVAGWGMDFWSTAVFIRMCLTAMIQHGAPSSYSPQ
jgi:hypothetical protein